MLETENAPITMTRSSAALVITPLVRCRPLAIAAVLSPVMSSRCDRWLREGG